jgi:hypothetical protein
MTQHGGRGRVCESVSGWAMGWQVKAIVLEVVVSFP